MTADRASRSRKLTDHERALWGGVTRSVAPLKRRRVTSEPNPVAPPQKNAVVSKRDRPVPVRLAPAPKGAPPLMPLDRRTRQRIARGTEAIDARIDLHSRTQSQAHEALLRFLRRAQRDGARNVLVITGKGGQPGEPQSGRGCLKRQVPLWLGLPEFRIHVLGFEDAHVGHGGEGALYVRLRRGR